VRFAVLDNTQFVEKVLFPVSALTPDFLFFKILMSESVTAEKFKEEITKVMKTCQRNEERARELTGRDWTGNAKIVVFIDELNTSNILGVIKEVFMDRTLDGKPLKDNIFFVGAINPAEHHTTPKSASSSSFSSSSSTEIGSVYRTAEDRQTRFERAEMRGEQCVVFLDEGGLPDERKHALKVFHYYADHPQVGTVILSNSTLDAAKTNRCIQVLLPKVDSQDLVALATGLLYGDVAAKERVSKSTQRTLGALIRGACAAFASVNQFADTKRDLFDLRDFVYLFRDIRREFLKDVARSISGDTVYHSL